MVQLRRILKIQSYILGPTFIGIIVSMFGVGLAVVG